MSEIVSSLWTTLEVVMRRQVPSFQTVQKTVEVVQPVPQERIQERIREQGVDIPLPHHGGNDGSGEKYLAKSLCFVAVLVLTSCGILSTWHRFCVLRSSVSKCPPALSKLSPLKARLQFFRIFEFWDFLSSKSSKTPR